MANNEFETIVNKSKEISLKWRALPAPQRGEFIRKFGEELRAKKDYLAETIQKRQERFKQNLRERFKKQLICVTLLLA